MQRFYYKSKDGKGFTNLKSPLADENYIQITEEEFNALTKPKIPELTAEQKLKQENLAEIAKYKKYLADTDYIVLKIAEALANNDTETVSTLRSEYATELAKRERARILINSIEKTQSI